MEDLYIAPISVEIKNFASPRKIGQFKFRRIKKEERRKYLGLEQVEFNPDGSLYKWVYTSESESRSPGFLDDQEYQKLIESKFIIETDNQHYMAANRELLISAFRLFKEGAVGSPVYFSTILRSTGYSSRLRSRNIGRYHISKSELNSVISLYKKITKIEDKNLELSLRRFNDATSESGYKPNAFLDFITILESLFLQDMYQELRFRFSLYISYILNNKIGIKITFSEIKKIYDTRSELLHSGKSRNYNQDLFTLTENLTRELVKWYINNYWKNKKAPFELMLKDLGIKK